MEKFEVETNEEKKTVIAINYFIGRKKTTKPTDPAPKTKKI